MQNIYHVTKDPVHDTMQFSEIENNWIKPFINHPIFQRLRHIKQLGMSDFIFPGAVHTRFNHCIGCCYVASRIAEKIGLSEEKRQIVMIACLLHDIGHGPFSHTFENLFESHPIRHENWTPHFLAEFHSTHFFDQYNRLNPRHPLSQKKLHDIENMIMHRTPKKNVLADIVSSQLDADRLDYLLRDSHFCGVSYGKFDFRWMLHCMTIIKTHNEERLGLTHKGIGVVEHYLMARRLMTRNIYHHQKKLAFEFFLIQFLFHLSQDLTCPLFLSIKETPLLQFLSAVKQFNQKQTKDIVQLQESFLKKQYKIYKELCDYDIFTIIRLLAQSNNPHPCVDLAKRLHFRNMPCIIRLDHSKNISEIKQMISNIHKNHSIASWQLALIETPHQSYSIEEDPIFIQNEQGRIKPLETISFMVQAFSRHTEKTYFLCIDYPIKNHTALKNLQKISETY